MPNDKEISMKRMRAFNQKEAELKQQGKSAAEANQGASEYLAMLEDEKPNEYLRAKDRKVRKKAMKIEEKERKAREQAEDGGEGGSATRGSERRGSAAGQGSSGGCGR